MKHVLVDDDDLLICDVTRQLLQIPGLQCHSARNYEQAVRVIEKCCPDLILLDLHLPGMSGVEISRRIRELPTGSQPQIVAFTGDAVRDVTEFASEHGF
ncbi:MAG: response regulator, partial [Planctomycetaceae bacterium]|nr:response regulator [Planctomycetaceae bacterium]